MIPLEIILFFTEWYLDMQLALKIFVLITLISFVKNHLGTAPLSLAVMAVIVWFVMFDMWWFFGGIYVLYTLLILGFSSIIIDILFVSGMVGGGQVKPGEHKGTGADAAARMERIKMMQHMMHPPRGR